MNRLLFFLALIFLIPAQGIDAQADMATGTPESNFSIYKSKLKKSEEGLTNEKKSSNAKFWISRAELMMDIFNLHRQFLQPGTQQIHVNLIYPNPKDKKTWQDDEGNL